MLWEWFWDIRSAQSSGLAGAGRISHQELAAWLGLTGNVLRREEIGVLKAMDARYCAGVDDEAEAIREREDAV